jgi:hypothetical protein
MDSLPSTGSLQQAPVNRLRVGRTGSDTKNIAKESTKCIKKAKIDQKGAL